MSEYHNNQFVTTNLTIGQIIINSLKLHFLTLLYILKGGIILGFFPAMFALVKVLYQVALQKQTKEVAHSPFTTTYKTFYRRYFKTTNYLGYLLSLVFLILLIDFKANRLFLNALPLQIFLIILFVINLVFFLYLPVIFSRYQLPFMAYFKQAFLMIINSPLNLIAALIGFALSNVIFVVFPLLLPLAGLPISLFLPVWFITQACLTVEKRVEKYEHS